jgi:hypothetical protein
VRVDIKKTLRVDLTRIIIGSTRTATVQLTTQRADLPRKVYFYSHAFDSTSVWLNENKNNNEKKKLSTILVPVDLKFMCIMMCLMLFFKC